MEIGPTSLKIMLNSFSYVLCVLGPTFLKYLRLGLALKLPRLDLDPLFMCFLAIKLL